MSQPLRNPTLDFQGCDGRWHAICRCSIARRYELSNRVQQLYNHITTKPTESTIPELYEQDSYFAFLCNEALKAANVEPEWLNPDQLMTLLFASNDFPFGALVEFNFGYAKAAKMAGKPEISELGTLIGQLWKSTKDFGVVQKLVHNYPCDVVDDILRTLEPPDKKWKDKSRQLYEQLANKNNQQ